MGRRKKQKELSLCNFGGRILSPLTTPLLPSPQHMPVCARPLFD